MKGSMLLGIGILAVIAGLCLALSIPMSIGIPENYNFTHDNLVFELFNNGIIKISDEHGLLAYQGWALSGEISGDPIRYTSEDFNWTWNKTKTSYNIRIGYDEETNESINKTCYIYTFVGYNNIDQFPIYWYYIFDENADAKWGLNITNNLGVPVTNMKGWLVHSFDKSDLKVIFNGTRYNLSENYHLTGDFSNLFPKVNMGNLRFFYSDLINSSFDLTDVYIGNGSVVGYPKRLIVAVGVTKGSGSLPNGYTIIFDPSESGYEFPDYTEGDWSNHAYLKISDNNRAEATAVYQIVNVSDFDFSSIPDSAEIVGIKVRVEGRCYSRFCPY